MDSLLPPTHGFTPASIPRPHFWGLDALWARLLLVGVLYAATGWLSVRFTLSPDGPAMLWLPNAVVLAALLLSPRRQWGFFAALMVPVELLVDWGTYSLPQALGFATANILEVLVGAYTITRLCGRVFSVQRVVHVGWFVVLGAGLASGLSALLGALLHPQHPEGLGLWGHWLVWWLGDALGLMVLTPLLLDLWGPQLKSEHLHLLRSWRWWPETLLLVVLNLLVFGERFTGLDSPALSVVLMLPAVAWLALRHGTVGGAWASLWTAAIAIVLTAAESGPYASGNLPRSDLQLQEFLLAVVLSALGLGAFVLEARQRENALRLFQRAVEASDDSIAIADAQVDDFPVVYVNQKFLSSTGYRAHEVLGHNCRFLSAHDRDQPGLHAVRQALQRAEPVQVSLRNYRKNGELYWNQLTLAPVFSERGALTHFIGVQHDITDIKRTQDELLAAKAALETQNQELEDRVQERTRELELLSTTDPLTGARNRRYLMDQAALEVARAHRYGHPLSCLLFDIDHFKRVNDAHGHDVGDRVLIAICMAVQAMLRPADTLARYGGEEFVVLLPDTDVVQARYAGERIRKAMQDMPVPAPGLDTPLRVTVSVGVATLSVLHADADALFKAADTAMYQAKVGGRNRVVVAGE
ncbi:diguanylate cyclase [Hydrogenophaga atypica]|uniref:Diguanylate cyclase n=1 Tax=Hydrogenophaga atypica TaxID=249409 RepID=A0ABW2QHV5_9BURK